jgi:hypothetical protein
MAFKNNSDTDSEIDKKKKNFVAGWFGLLLPPRFLEFETPLTSRECYERLQKLPGKMVYLKAKNKVELANAAMQPFQLQWRPDENICEFIQSSRNRQSNVVDSLFNAFGIVFSGCGWNPAYPLHYKVATKCIDRTGRIPTLAYIGRLLLLPVQYSDRGNNYGIPTGNTGCAAQAARGISSDRWRWR